MHTPQSREEAISANLESTRVKLISRKLREFEQAMGRQIWNNRNKGTAWRNDDIVSLLERLDDEVKELRESIEERKSAEVVLGEAADVANFCMFIADRVKLYQDPILREIEDHYLECCCEGIFLASEYRRRRKAGQTRERILSSYDAVHAVR